MTNQKHIAMRRRMPFPKMMSHCDVMRQWAQRYVVVGPVEQAYWGTHLAIYRQLNEGPIHALVRHYLPLESRLPRW